MIDTKTNEKATGSFGTQSLLIAVKIFSRANKKKIQISLKYLLHLDATSLDGNYLR